MSRTWSSISDKERERLATAFAVLKDVDSLILPSDANEPPLRDVTLSDLYQFLTTPDFSKSKIVTEALRTNAKLRSDFNVLLGQLSICHMPTAAAAMSDEIIDRRFGGFSVKVRPTSRGDEHVYLLVEAEDKSQGDFNVRVVAQSNDGTVIVEVLPAAVDGIAQKLISKDSDIVSALASAATTIDIL